MNQKFWNDKYLDSVRHIDLNQPPPQYQLRNSV